MPFEKHLLVDGSNIMHAWPHLKPLLKRDREAARTELSLAVRAIHDVEQWRVTVVFDGRGTDLVIEHPYGHTTFSHVYTPAGTTADDVIEQLAGTATSPADVLVATDDRAERQTVEASGAQALSAAELAARVTRAKDRQAAQLSGLRRENEREWRRPKS